MIGLTYITQNNAVSEIVINMLGDIKRCLEKTISDAINNSDMIL